MITVLDVSKLFMVSTKTVYRWVKLGMPFIKVSGSLRFEEEEVVAWAKKWGQKNETG